VILDLGKGDELPSIFAALVPKAQRVIVAPQELDATLQPGVNAAKNGMSFIALKMAYLKHVLRVFFVFFF
jgi:predicted nicotinamide N-methyase